MGMDDEWRNELRFRCEDYHDGDGVVISDFKTIREPREWDFRCAVEKWCEDNHACLDYPMELKGHYRYGDGPWVPVFIEGRTTVEFYATILKEPKND